MGPLLTEQGHRQVRGQRPQRQTDGNVKYVEPQTSYPEAHQSV